MRRREFIALLGGATTWPLAAHGQKMPGVLNRSYQTIFRQAKIGGGGFVCNIRMSPDGLSRTHKTDVYGAYIWANSNNRSATDATGMHVDFKWCQLITNTSMPEGERNLGYGTGYSCYDVAPAPSQSTTIYAIFYNTSGTKACLYRSTDRGVTWVKKTLPAGDYSTGDFGGPYRTYGHKMVIDPDDPDTVYVCDNYGKFTYSRNGGTSWTIVSTSAVPLGTPACIAVDPSSSLISGRRSVVYVCTGANGVYRSTDAGLTWAAMSGSPAHATRFMHCDSLGRLWITNSNIPRNCYRYASSVWTQLTPSFGDGYNTIYVNPFHTSHVAAQYSSGTIIFSSDNGATWTSPSGSAGPKRGTSDIPWLSNTNEDYFSNGIGCYDPVTDGRFWIASGIGVYYCNAIPRTNRTWGKYVELTRGNEELICNQLIKQPGKPLIGVFWDRSVFRIDDVDKYPSDHGVAYDNPIRHGWSLDYAKNDPNFLAIIANGGSGNSPVERSSYSTDNGVTWTSFASRPSTDFNWGGAIAVSTPTNICWFPSNAGRPHFTNDGGATWRPCRFPAAVPTAVGFKGWNGSYFTPRYCVWADHETPNKFYAYNYGGTNYDHAYEGFYVSTDGGANWARAGYGASGGLSGGSRGYNFVGSMGDGMVGACVPGRAGHFFWACGRTGNDQPHPYDADASKKVLIFSDDSATNAYKVSGFTEAWSVSYGKAKPGASYPAIFVSGQRVGDTHPGVYRCDDWSPATRNGTWTRLASDYGTVDSLSCVCGDLEVYGKVYVGLKGSGVIVGELR